MEERKDLIFLKINLNGKVAHHLQDVLDPQLGVVLLILRKGTGAEENSLDRTEQDRRQKNSSSE